MWRSPRDTAVCGNGGADVVLGTLTCSPTSLFGPTAIYGFPATGLAETFTLGNAGQPAGNTNSWLIPNIAAAAAFTRLYSRTAALDVGNNRAVTEEVKGGYLAIRCQGRGVRACATRSTPASATSAPTRARPGINSGVAVTVKRNYDDWLPAVNLALLPGRELHHPRARRPR